MKFILLGFFIRFCIAFWNGFWGPSFGADLDAQGMHRNAARVAENLAFDKLGIGTEPYTNLLGFFYWLTTDSLFLGSLLSCFAWLISAFYLLKSIQLLNVSKNNQKWILLIYALLPSSFLYTSVTLREPYQLLFVNIAIYAALKIIIKKHYASWWLLLVGCIGAGALHGALMAFAIALIAMTLFFSNSSGKIPKWMKLAITAPFIALVLIYGMSFFSESAYQLDDGVANAVEKYQEGGLAVEGRTNYKTEVATSGLLGFVLFIPVSLFQYLFEPMPWRISSIVDVPVFMENILRFWLIWIAIKYYRSSSLIKQSKKPVLFIILAYFIIETIWSLGTINWGTASRHHIPSIGILLMMAFALKPYNRKTHKIQ
jgi:hypothetical protein